MSDDKNKNHNRNKNTERKIENNITLSKKDKTDMYNEKVNTKVRQRKK